jgi:hypothetical protein
MCMDSTECRVVQCIQPSVSTCDGKPACMHLYLAPIFDSIRHCMFQTQVWLQSKQYCWVAETHRQYSTTQWHKRPVCTPNPPQAVAAKDSTTASKAMDHNLLPSELPAFSKIATADALNMPPLPYTSALRAPCTCLPAASPRSCVTASTKLIMAGTSQGAP